MSRLTSVIGRGKSAGPNGSIIVEAGWNTPDCYLEGTALLKVENKLKSLRIQTEMKGLCETRWELSNAMATDSTKLATKVESNDYKVLKHSRIFQQSYDLVYESRDSVFPDPSGSPIAFNFKFKLPRNDMPPSFDHPAGSVIYTLKAIASFYEGRNFSKTTVELEVPMTVIMPESAKLKLLEAPNPMDTFVPATSGMCSYSLQIPKTVLVVGETLVVNLTIGSTPENARLQSVSTSLNIAAGFSTAKTTVGFNHSSTNKEATFARFPRPVGEVLDTFPSLKVGRVGGVEPVVRRYELYIDPEVALPSFGSQLIAINTIFRLQITTDDGIPNVHLEVPVVVLPQAVNRTVVPSNPVNLWSPTSSTTSRTTQPAPSPSASPSLRPTPLPSPAPGMNISSRQYQQVAPLPTQPVYQVVPILRSPPLSPVTSQRSQQTDRVTSLPPSYEETPNTETEIQRLNNEQAKLTELLAEIQRFELSQSPPRTEMLRSELNRIGSQSASMLDGTSSIRSRSQSVDGGSITSMDPTPEWTADQVSEWVRQKGAPEEVVNTFKDQAIDGSVLLTLTAEDLRDELKVTQLGIRRKILIAIEKLQKSQI